ncbi:Uma2 family endonuclease [Filimonas effusa]|uniref:Uma2 family endonuclease n=1 Tax=Filimonas effusa TaxID=2508721 RepID=A0A4Q1D7R1_9BACT|nr:Uma2 family endonuclease [Filimonas effusa]RXK85337.1 Uma2 family endonuclease [Filimonas effusa]
MEYTIEDDDELQTSILREAAVAYGKSFFTEKEYLSFEEKHLNKFEYYQGQIFAMAGAGARHHIIFKNVFGELAYKLKKKKCQPYGSDLRIHIPENTLFTYPDISIICGSILPSVFDAETGTHPTAIIEILSNATRDYDKGMKFRLYRDIPGFKEYVLIDSETVAAEVWRPAPEGERWLCKKVNNLSGALFIKTVELSLRMEEIYEGTLLHD